MNSSLEPAAVEAFEYLEPGRVNPTAATSAVESRVTSQNGPAGRETSDQLDLKLAAAHAEGIREGLQQAQESFDKQLAEERTRMAEALRDFAQKNSEYYSRAEVELVHLALAIAAKILHREAQVDRMLVAALVKVAMDKLQQGTTATVRVRPEEVGDWNRYFEGNPDREIRLEVKADPRSKPTTAFWKRNWGSRSSDWTRS